MKRLSSLLLVAVLTGCVREATIPSDERDIGPYTTDGDSGGPIIDAIPDVFAGRTLALIGPTSLVGGVCSEPFELSRVFTNDDGDPTADATVALLSGSGRGAFYRDADCAVVIDSITIAKGTRASTFHLKVPVAEQLILHADDSAEHFAPAAFKLDVKPTPLTVEALYPKADAWNDYLDDDGKDAFSATGKVCPETGDQPCLHGGELKRVKLAGLTDCGEVDFGDALEVFEWICRPETDGLAFYSKGLRSDRGLKDLLTVTAWRENHFEVRLDGIVARSEDTTWWNNPVRRLPTNNNSPWIVLDDKDDDEGGPDEVFEPGTILTVEATQLTNGYNINIDALGLVTLGQATLVYDDATAKNCQEVSGESVKGYNSHICLLSAGEQKHLWIEGSFDGSHDANVLLNMGGVSHSTVRQVMARNAKSYGFTLRGSNFNRINATVEDTWSRGWIISKSNNNQIDGAVSRRSADMGISISESNGNVLHDVLIEEAKAQSLYFDSGSDNRFVNLTSVGGQHDTTALTIYGNNNQFYNVRAHNNNGYGVIVGGNDNRFVDIVATNNRFAGLRVGGNWLSPKGNSFVGVVAANNDGFGVSVSSATDKDTRQNTFSHVTAINNSGDGVGVSYTDMNVLHQIVTVNNGAAGLSISNGSQNTAVYDLVSIANAGDQVSVENSADSLFHGRLIVGGSDTPCRATGTRPGLIDGTCTVAGKSGNDYGTELSDAAFSQGAQIVGAFVGKVTANDVKNSADDNGSQAPSKIVDWHYFDTPYRFWGADGDSFPSADNRDRCLDGICRIWDVGLRDNPSVLFSVNGAFSASASSCPAATADVITDQQPTANTFLSAATEVAPDGIGDDDGLCESGEVCIFSPHLGAYQGHGQPVGACSDAALAGVTLKARPSVGY